MRRRSLVVPVAILALATACAHSPQAAPPTATPAPAASPSVTPAAAVDPVGVYDFTTVFEGDAVSGTITITGSPGAYRGTVSSSVTPDMPIRSVTVRGSTITVTADSDNGELVSTFTLTGQELTGEWSLGDASGTTKGRKRPG
ncbi:MAG TPA: hypothetical protein VF048_06935 [Gemmatimonadaceae bacterium]|jgi:hypothetical protein